MKAVIQKGLLAALAALALASSGCGPTPPANDGGTGGGGGGDTCIEDIDCPDPTLFFCNTTTSKCEPACRTKNDCTAGVRGQYALSECEGSLGCQCDEGKCTASLCSADVDCGTTLVCRSGKCEAGPAASTVASCQITPDYAVLKVGAKVTFHVSAWDAAKKPVIVKEGATWTALGTGLTGSGTGNSAEFTAAAATTGPVESAQAAFGAVTCKAKALVLPAAVPANSVNVVVLDELSGRPVVGAQVLASTTAGADIGAAVATNASGLATVDVTGNATYSVSAFHADYGYLTVANYTPAGADAGFLALVVRRNQIDKFGGYKGTFTDVPRTSNVHAAVASAAIPGAITSISVAQLLGPSIPTDVKIGSAIDEKGVPIPAGAYLGFTDQVIKANVSAQGLASTCVDGTGAADEASIAAGTCGTTTAWALTGDVPLGDLPIDALAGGGELDIGALLSRITPIFKKFNSAIVRDVQYTLKPTPGASTGSPDFTDTSSFTTADLKFDQIPLAFSFATNLADLPKYKNTFADGVLVLGGASIPGRGVVPLGIGVGVNTNPADAKVDKQAELPSAGLVQVRMAPTHSGVEGSEYGLIVAAISAKGLTDSSAGLGASVVYARPSGNKLLFDQKGTTPIDLSAQAFPPFPEGLKYNFTDAAQGAVGPRQLKFAAASGAAGTQAIRATYSDALDRRWDVLFDTSAATSGVTLPKPPGALADRTFANGLSTGGRSALVGQVMRMTANGQASGTALSFSGLVEFNSTNFDRVTSFLTGFGFIDYGVPKVEFTAPDTSPATVVPGGNLEVAVTQFKIGTTAADDGVVKLTFETSAGAPVAVCPAVNLSTETTAGNGKLRHQLVAGCLGTSLTVRAALYQPDGTTAIAPAVATSTVITIQ